MNFTLSDLFNVSSLLIAIVSACYARKANVASKEANQLSSKSIAINYDSTFNDFNIQLRKNICEVRKIKEDFKKIKSQNTKYMRSMTKWVENDIKELQTQYQYMRPSMYHGHYEELERLGEDIKSQCEILRKISDTSEEENLLKDRIYLKNYNKTLEYFDLVIEKLEMKTNDIF